MALCSPGYRGSLAKFAQFSCKLASDFVVISEATIFNGTIVLPVTGVLWKRLITEMPQKLLLRNFRFILGNPSKLEKGEGFPNIFEGFPNI